MASQIGKYDIVRRLGRGGMGTVFLGHDPDLGRPVAIKVLHEHLYEEELLQRFLQEARAAASLRHDNIVTVYDVGQCDRQPYMAMEYVDGTSLADLIRDRTSLTLADQLSCLEQLCAGLHHAHLKKIVHRDIKPANLMIDRSGVLRILDFGIARIEGSAMTSDGSMIGTLNYMSPEQMLGQPVDYRSDIFSVGAVAYELLSSQKAFGGSTHDGLLQRLAHDEPPSLADAVPGIPPALIAVVMRALAKRPGDRFSSLDEMRLALGDVRHSLDSQYELTIIAPPRDISPSLTPPPSSRLHPGELAATRIRQRDTAARTSRWRQGRVLLATRTVPVAMAFVMTVSVGYGIWSRSSTTSPSSGSVAQPPVRQPETNDATSVTRSPDVTMPAERDDPSAGTVKGHDSDRTIPDGSYGTRVPSTTVTSPSTASPASTRRGRVDQNGSGNRGDDVVASSTIPRASSVSAAPAGSPTLVTPSNGPSAPAPDVAPHPPAPIAPDVGVVPGPASAAPPAAPAAVPAIAVEGPHILRLLTRYQDAYRNMDVDAIGNVYVTFPRESRQQLERNFKACQAFDATFGTPDSFIGNDATLATVNVRITYVCTPKTRQAPIVSSADEVFRLRKIGGEWLIERAGNMNTGVSR